MAKQKQQYPTAPAMPTVKPKEAERKLTPAAAARVRAKANVIMGKNC